MKNKLTLIIIIALFAFVIECLLVSATSSVLLSDQGTDVRNSSGSLLGIGNLTITIYDNATEGNLIFNQTFSSIIANGSWNLMISPALEFGSIYWKDYSINGEDLDFDGNERISFQSSRGLINNVSFINFSLIKSCSAGSSIRLIYENGSVECEIDDSGSTSIINSSNFSFVAYNWSTSTGMYSGTNSTQFESVGGLLHIVESWFATAWNNLFRNFFNQDLNTTASPKFNEINITGGYIWNGTDKFLISDLNKTGTSGENVNASINIYLSRANASYLTTYNATYDAYSTNVSTNWTKVTFDTYNTTWEDILSGDNVNASINEYLTRANSSYLTTFNASYNSFNSTLNIQNLYNLTASLIANFSINDFLNKTINMYFTGANASNSANINLSINDYLNETINQYLTNSNTSYLTTFNATYDAYATNVSTNWTKVTFDTYNTTWDDIISGENVNASIREYLNSGTNASYLTTANASYSSFNSTLNIQNLYNLTASLIANFSINDFLNRTINIYFTGANSSQSTNINFSINDYLNKTINMYLTNANASYLSTYNATYAANMGNASWNESYANSLYTNKSGYNTTQFESIGGMIHLISSWIEGLIQSVGLSLGFNNTFNSTYDSYALNVSTNWTKVTFDTYNTTWDDIISGENVNASIREYLNSGTNASYLTTANASYNSFNSTLNIQNLYNLTASLIANFSINDFLNKTINMYFTGANASGSANINSSINWFLNSTINMYLTNANASYLSTYNATYAAYVTFNNTLNIQNLYNATASMIANLSAGQYLANTNTSASQIANDSINQYLNSTINQYLTNANASYLSTFNSTYDAYATNVSTNWTKVTFDTYNTTWDDIISGENVNASINEYLTRANASYLTTFNASYNSFNSTLNIQNLYNLTASLIANFSINDFLNRTINIYFTGANSSQSTNINFSINDYLNKTINMYLTNANASYLSTYNATYAANLANNSWNESLANSLYTNKSGYNVTQFESVGGMIHLISSWIEGLIQSVGLSLGFNNTFNSTYDSYALNVSTNWTKVTFDTYNTTWDDVIAGENVNASIREYLNSGTNASYLTTANASYNSFNSTLNIQNLYNLTASLIANFSINDFLNRTINIYFTGANSSQSTNINFSINDYLNKTINMYLTNANASYLSTYNATYAAYVTFNNTLNIQNLYNATASMIANLSAGQYLANTNTSASMIANASINQYLTNANASYLSTFNSTYDAYATNVSTNWTLVTFNTYNTTWDDILTGENVNASINEYLTRANSSYLTTFNSTYATYGTFNTTLNIQNLYNLTASLIANFSINDFLNKTINMYFTGANASGSSNINSSINWFLNSTINMYLTSANASYLSTYNATYDSYSANISRNWTLDAYNAWNAAWSSTYNATYAANIGNASWNESYADTLYTNKSGYNTTQFESVGGMIHLISSWIEGLIQSVGLSLGFNNTYNATYDAYSTNVSTNWTKVTFDTYNTTWDDIITGENVNASINEYLTRANASYLTTFNASYNSFNTTFNIQNLYNLTASLIANFSINDFLNKTINMYFTGANASGSANINSSINWFLNSTINMYLTSANTSYLSTYNATYDSYSANISRNWTLDAYNAWNAVWSSTYNASYATFNNTLNIQNLYNATASMIANLSASQYLANTNTSASMIANASINQYLTNANASYLSTFNSTYDAYATNVSTNWTLVTFNTYNTTWDDILTGENVNASINEYLTRANSSYLTTFNSTYATYGTFNTTLNIQNLYNLTASLIANFSINDFLNKTINMYFTGANASGSSNINSSINWFLNSTINMYLTSANASYLSTYNATYDSYSANISRNWTLDAYNAWNAVWSSTYNATYAANMGNASWNESYADTLYTNKSGYNTTQFESVGGMIHLISSWIEGLIQSVGLSLGFNNTYNATYDAYSTNVSTNWTKVTFDTYNTTWDDIITGDNVNASINEYLTRANASYLTTFNASYNSFNTTFNIQNLYNLTASMIANFSINDFLNKTINMYFTGANSSQSLVINSSINWFLNSTINMYLTSANVSYLSTYNATYAAYATFNTTLNIQNLYNSTAQMWINLYLTNANSSYLSTYNATYDSYALNVSRNWTISANEYTDIKAVNKTGDSMTGNLNMTSKNVTSVDCIVFASGGKICSA